MPSARDLTGARFGSLSVVEPAEPAVSPGGQRLRRWLCRCDCGRLEVVRQDFLRLPRGDDKHRQTSVAACATCRHTRRCVVCSLGFQSIQKRATCSEACRTLHQRAQQLDHYYRVRSTPEEAARRHEIRRARHAAAPDVYRERTQKSTARRAERMRSDPLYAERIRAWARAWYARNAERVLAERAERTEQQISAMNDDELYRHVERLRAYSRDHRRRERAAAPLASLETTAATLIERAGQDDDQ